MKTIKTSELQGAALDWAVAKCKGIEDERIVLQSRYQFPGEKVARQEARVSVRWLLKQNTPPEVWSFCGQRYEPSTDWAQGGPIIERERICVNAYVTPPGAGWNACTYPAGTRKFHLNGPTPLIAAMRCYVASKMGDEIEVPEELL